MKAIETNAMIYKDRIFAITDRRSTWTTSYFCGDW